MSKPFRIGAVGVGPWSQKLATAFRECGAEIVCHDRYGRNEWENGNPKLFGYRVKTDYMEMIANPEIDAIVSCAPPTPTTAVALECLVKDKRCVATKPLLWNDIPQRFDPWGMSVTGETREGIAAKQIYVDLWRLYSPAWLAMKEELRGRKIDRIDVSFCGNGPFRSFNGAFDYGPHALAFVFDLIGTGETELLSVEPATNDGGGTTYTVQARLNGVRFSMAIGNGCSEAYMAGPSGRYSRCVAVRVEGETLFRNFDEPPGLEIEQYIAEKDHMTCSKGHALRRFCRAFMAGESSRTLEFSIAGQRVLERIVKA